MTGPRDPEREAEQALEQQRPFIRGQIEFDRADARGETDESDEHTDDER